MTIQEYGERFERAVVELYAKLRRVPAVREIAERMEVSERTLYRWGEEDRAGTGPPAEAAQRIVSGLERPVEESGTRRLGCPRDSAGALSDLRL